MRISGIAVAAALAVLGGCSNPAGNVTGANDVAPSNVIDNAMAEASMMPGGNSVAAPSQPAVPAALAAAAAACRGLPADGAAAARLIVERGWPQQGGNAPDGRPSPIFSRDNVVIMMLANADTARQGGALCNVVGAIDPAVTMADLIAAMTAALGGPPAETRGNQAAWELGGSSIVALTRLPGPPTTAANIYIMPAQGSRDGNGPEGLNQQ